MEPPMQFRKAYTLSQKDYVLYNRYTHRRQLVLMPLLFIVLIMALCLFMIFGAHAAGPDALFYVTPLVVAFAVGITIVNAAMMNSQARRRYQASAALKSAFELVIGRKGIRESGDAGSSTVEWSRIAYAKETRHAIYIHLGHRRAFVIPKALLNPKETDIIYQLLKKYLGRKCRIRKR
jgi:hypothetical protein